MNPHSLAKKRKLGAYYTPPELSQILANWAISASKDNILEPSFGGCGFLDSCITRLRELGSKAPKNNLFGVDIDEHAFDILSQKFKLFSLEKRFILNDFIKVGAEDFKVDKFDVVLGNPPYVSMHNMSIEQRNICKKILKQSPFSDETIGSNASLWAYFLLHSLSFIREGGKVAWVLPSSLLHANYALALMNIHRAHFHTIKIAKIGERFFKSEGASESSVVMIAQGFTINKKEKCDFRVCSVSDLKELNNFIFCNSTDKKIEQLDYKLSFLPDLSRDAYLQVASTSASKKLSDYADIKIGMVTGANKVFVIDKETKDKEQLSDCYVKPVMGKFSSFIGLKHNQRRQDKIIAKNNRALLVSPSPEDMIIRGTPIRSYLSVVKAKERRKNRTFKKRRHWHYPDDHLYPDGFFSYMVHHGPKLIINQCKVNCTNSIHRVFFKEKKSYAEKMALSMSLLSSFSQLSAEIGGRAYGSGVLKIEPTAGKSIRLLMSENCIEELSNNVSVAEAYLSQGQQFKVMELVDQILIKHNLITASQCEAVRVGVHFLRKERYKGVSAYNEQF